MFHRQLLTKTGRLVPYRAFTFSATRLQDGSSPPFTGPSTEGTSPARITPHTVDIDAILPPNKPSLIYNPAPRISRGLPPLSRPGFRSPRNIPFEGEAPRPMFSRPRTGSKPKPRGKGAKGAPPREGGGRPRRNNWEPDPPAEQVDVEYTPAVLTVDALAGEIPATLVSAQGVGAMLRRGVPVGGGDTVKWSAGKWKRRDEKREKVAREMVEGVYESPVTTGTGVLAEVKRMVVVNESYSEKARSALVREVEGLLVGDRGGEGVGEGV